MEAILGKAREQEKEYNWLGAAELYTTALGVVPEQEFSQKGEICERLGYAFYKAAMQAESRDEFRDRTGQAVAYYEEAKEFYERLSELLASAGILRCDAMKAYIDYWLSSDASEKKRLVNECWRLASESLKGFKKAGDSLEYGKTYNQLSNSVVFGFCYEWDFQTRDKMIREAIEHGEQAIKFLSDNADPHELAMTYARTAFFLGVFDYYFLDISEKYKGRKKALDYWAKAKELSEDVALFELLHPIFGGPILLWGEATEETLTSLKKALEYGGKTKDKFIIGCALDWLVYHTAWSTARIAEDPDELSRMRETVLQYVQDARHQFSAINFVSPRGDYFWIEAPDTERFSNMGFYETDLKKKRDLYEKAREAAQDGLQRAELSGYPEVLWHVHQILSILLFRMSMTETQPDVKKQLLEEALIHINKSLEPCDNLQRFLYWNRGATHAIKANIKFELANLVKDQQSKVDMLQEALTDMENAYKLCTMEVQYFETTAYFYPLGFWWYRLGTCLNFLYTLTHDKEHLKKAAKAFTDATEFYEKIDLKSRIAECHWKAAQALDNMGEYLKASESFDVASSNYRSAAEKIPQFKDFYLNQALYMQSWREIERARHHHARQEYGLAQEHFEKAAVMHKSLKQWNYLTPNYAAWTQVENAEDLSRKEQSEEAIKAFEHAASLFNETKESLRAKLGKIEDEDEKQMVTSMVKATDLRHKYCNARIAIEEAKILDKKGDHYSSSEKYGSAVDSFEKICQTLEPEQERKEIGFIVNLSKAWQKMTLAEAESSPTLYAEASQLFEQAKDLSPNEKTKMLVLGHSRFCRALEAGTRFVDTRDQTMHATAVQHLASAANYYAKADFQNASEYAKATKLLFDSYLHMDNAEKENDLEKKAKLYIMTEKVLQTSAGYYTKAEHPEKMEQVLKLLEKVKEEQELATSLTEALHAPSIISTTKAFPTPTPTHEEAVGSERFEHADIQANIIPRQKELKVGENLNLEIELVNAGRSPALLIKVAEIIPQNFEVTEIPANYRVEDSYINMKGKRLDPLKTEEVRITLKPKTQGVFQLKPKILYIDENGKYKAHEPEPTQITVKELGIKGWLKGDR